MSLNLEMTNSTPSSGFPCTFCLTSRLEFPYYVLTSRTLIYSYVHGRESNQDLQDSFPFS